MDVNGDFSKRASAHAATTPWVPSPMKGVDRRMLDRLGGEVARATSIVRYAPQSSFSAHTHMGGEEYIVLDGVFQDEDGDFGVGSYVRNPPMSSHVPRSEPGCVIFVKLWQFDPNDREQFHKNMDALTLEADPAREGVERASLHEDAFEKVALERWAPGAAIALDAPNGLEILVLEGSFVEAGEAFEAWSWLRLPRGARATAKAGDEGARLWIKRDHLAHDPTPPTP